MKTKEELLQSGYKFNSSELFAAGWNLMSKHFGPLVGMTLLFVIISIVLSSIEFVSVFANIIGIILSSGFYIFLMNSRSKKNDPKDFFGGFKFTVDIFLHRLTLGLFLVPFFLILFLIGFPFMEIIKVAAQMITPEEFAEIMRAELYQNGMLFAVSILILFIGGVYFYVSYVFTIPLIVIGKMKFWEAMETSRKVVGMRFFGIFANLIVLGILVILMTVVTCGLGALVAIPLATCIVFCAYESIFEPHEGNEQTVVDEFGSASPDYNSESELD
jgi:hypothetical protein